MKTIVIIWLLITIIIIASMTTIVHIDRMTTILITAPMQIRRPGELGAIISETRRARGMTQGDLAEKLGVSRVWIGQIERGKPSARLDLIFRVLNELEIVLAVSCPGDAVPETKSREEPDTLLDIDSIADTGLASYAPPPKRKR